MLSKKKFNADSLEDYVPPRDVDHDTNACPPEILYEDRGNGRKALPKFLRHYADYRRY